MQLDRRTLLGSLGAATATSLAGCIGGGGDSEAAARIGMVYATGGLGDGSFNDQAQTGAVRAEEELSIAYDESQPDTASEFGTLQQQYAQSTDPAYDLVCCIGFLQADSLTENASEYPDQQFMIVDFVGGRESDLIKRFEAGYTAGVKYASEDVDVQTAYVGDFNDPSGGQEAAISMFDSGADIVYHAAGNTGTGVFQAAQEAGKFAIGVDRDQSVTKSSYSDVILASMVKRVDNAVFSAVDAVVNDNFEGGTTTALGLEQDGVEAVYGQDLGSEIPQDLKDEVSTVRDDIIAGDISVPTDPGDV